MKLDTLEEIKISSKEKISLSLISQNNVVLGVSIRSFFINDKRHWQLGVKDLIFNPKSLRRLSGIISLLDCVLSIEEEDNNEEDNKEEN